LPLYLRKFEFMLNKVAIVFLSLSMSMAIMAPSLINLLDLDATSIALVELTEEETPQKHKKQLEENKIVHRLFAAEGFIFSEKRNKAFQYYKEGSTNYILEINLPPPEYLL
jgi:hypothetical protein